MMKSMRTEAILLTVAIAFSFFSGLAIYFTDRTPPQQLTEASLDRKLRLFKETTSSGGLLRFDGRSEFLDPAMQLPFYYKFDYGAVRALKAFSETCRESNMKFSEPVLEKAWQWQKALCEKRDLPDSFATTAPFFHPSGHSYAFLFNNDSAWKEKHQNYFHVIEVKQAGIKISDPELSVLAQIDWPDLDLISGQAPIIDAGEIVLVKDNFAGLAYHIYSGKDWRRFWSETPFKPSSIHVQGPCLHKQNALCWNYDVRQANLLSWSPLVLVLALSLVPTFGLSALLIIRLRTRAREEARLKFALEMLTHELRTPLTNLTLNTEQLRSQFDRLPPSSQSVSLRMFDQIERLRRVADSSRSYLSKDLKTSLLAPKFCEILSLTTFIEHTVEPFRVFIELDIEDDHLPLRVDPYWTSICIKNLVENAVKHGQKPILVKVAKDESCWTIEVGDQGMETFNIDKKGTQSDGLGLGLKLTQRILPFLEGQLTVQYRPTRFRIQFNDAMKEIS